MKISPINLYNSVNFSYGIKRAPLFCGLKEDVFEKYKENAKTPFGLDYSIKEKYKNADEMTLCCVGPSNKKEMAEEIYQMSKLTEEMFDKKYGEDNWVCVSIGTSPAGIGKGLELRGKDVRYLPISEIHGARPLKVLRYMSKDKHPEYLEYLDFVGITKEKINNDTRHYLFVDYTHSGQTLNAIKTFAYSNGLKRKNTHFISLNNELIKYAGKTYGKEAKEKAKKHFDAYYLKQKIGGNSGVLHVPYYDTSAIANTKNFDWLSVFKKEFENLICAAHFKDEREAKNNIDRV